MPSCSLDHDPQLAELSAKTRGRVERVEPRAVRSLVGDEPASLELDHDDRIPRARVLEAPNVRRAAEELLDPDLGPVGREREASRAVRDRRPREWLGKVGRANRLDRWI